MDLHTNATSQPLSSVHEEAYHGVINYTEYHESERRNNDIKQEIKEEPEEEEIDASEEECGLGRESVRCCHCGEKRFSKEELREHIDSCRSLLFVGQNNGRDIGKNNDEKPFKCDVCNYRTTKHFVLKEHIRKHTGEMFQM
ncbi:hypothetical protein J437_LFUL003493 [Ladona fulva]|uniref:C2H2-type domain-containing protein n=1 Tax=Ladona fulva TaxID=123851 RepID=A0A8K0NT23_LADFU|nr:hypothetical protein J437_LFUL003493 [Ladona fulva]